MKMNELMEKNLEQVTGGVHTPLGDYPAEQLIDMYNNDPTGAVSFINMAKAYMPSLVNAFKAECATKGLTIPDGLLALL